ncbi:sensor histidine kinase [Larkinella insperata]|uniref:histidine kinase n=1 Tax=Larkinella insperata TaxID=332158 RepID=A0ABW3QBH1_9BACT|nr:HAMP domain-containing sensor histidine kinase [Larkinella insperata]
MLDLTGPIMATPSADQHPIQALVAFLFSRREPLLNNWRTACEADPELPQIEILTREEFNNLMPLMLDIMEKQLLGQPPTDELMMAALSHGLHRWQKANGLAALIRELNHLAAMIEQELLLYGQLYPEQDTKWVLQAQVQINQQLRTIILGSISKYDELQRLEATSRATSLQHALEHMNALSRHRGDLLRTSSHDLRGGLSIIRGAAQLINLETISDEERLQYQEMLNRNLGNVQSMLGQLMDLARLEAGLDPLQNEAFDAAALLQELVTGAQPLAIERGLILRADGPPSLQVETDRVKIYRIAQNLVVNALQYTHSGIVSVTWSAENDWRWGFSVQDSGPGLPAGLIELFHQQLKPTVEPTSVLSPEEGRPTPVYPDQDHTIPPRVSPTRSDGVGLHIVKRLCEQIGASLEVESIQGRGTIFRLRMLIHHQSR